MKQTKIVHVQDPGATVTALMRVIDPKHPSRRQTHPVTRAIEAPHTALKDESTNFSTSQLRYSFIIPSKHKKPCMDHSGGSVSRITTRMKIRGSMVSYSFIFPHPPEDEKKKKTFRRIGMLWLGTTLV